MRSQSEKKTNYPLNHEFFEKFNGYFLNPDITKNLKIKNFEYRRISLLNHKSSGTAFLSLSTERVKGVLGKKVRWMDGNIVATTYFKKYDLLVTEKPILELKDELPQYIVPNVWNFMHDVSICLRKKNQIPVIAITGSVGKSSTRLMLEHVLGNNNQILANEGNHNTRFAIPLYMTKFAQNPDIAILELSFNSLNYKDRGPQSILVKPTIAILTSIDYAHMSTVKNLNHLATFKSNIFKGLAKDGIAIINHDIAKEPFEIAYKAAAERTTKIRTYSMRGEDSDLNLVSMNELKDLTEVTVDFKGRYYTYYLSLSGSGTVENSLAVILVLDALGYNIERYLEFFASFHSLPKIMEKKSGKLNGYSVDIIDDTHNAAIPSMINAIQSFKKKCPYYKGNKILALGQVADLGIHSKELHNHLIPFINESSADLFIGYGEELKSLVENVSIKSDWYDDLENYHRAILNSLSENSLLLLKGSVSGSDYHNISEKLSRSLISETVELQGV